MPSAKLPTSMSILRRALIILLLGLGLSIRLAAACVNGGLPHLTEPAMRAQSTHVAHTAQRLDWHAQPAAYRLRAARVPYDGSADAAHEHDAVTDRVEHHGALASELCHVASSSVGHPVCDAHVPHYGAGQCSHCGACCVGAPLPGASGIGGMLAWANFHLFPQPSVGAVRFLTDGIDRPPSTHLV